MYSKAVLCLMLVQFVCSSPILKVIEKVVDRERRAVETTDNCTVPTNIETLFSDLRQHINVTRFLLLTDLNVTEKEVVDTPTPPACNNNEEVDATSPIEELSTCPWYYVNKNLGENFFPSSLPEAKCLCDNCSGDSLGRKCIAVRRVVTVLKKTGCSNRFYTYEPSKQLLSVSCTCVRQAN